MVLKIFNFLRSSMQTDYAGMRECLESVEDHLTALEQMDTKDRSQKLVIQQHCDQVFDKLRYIQTVVGSIWWTLQVGEQYIAQQ